MDNKYLKGSYSSIGIKLGGCDKKIKKTHKKVRSKKKSSLRGIVLENRVKPEDYLDSVRTALKAGL